MNRKGFVLIEIFLLIFVAMVLGGTGWYVWNAKKETDKNFNDSNSASNSTFLYASRPSLGEATRSTNLRWHAASKAGGLIGTKLSGEASAQVRESEIGTTGLPD